MVIPPVIEHTVYLTLLVFFFFLPHILADDPYIPLYGSVWIQNPPHFFAILDNSPVAATSTYSQQFFATEASTKAISKRKTKMTLMEVAFSLLEWAHYGRPLAELIENYGGNENAIMDSEEEEEEEDVMIVDESHEGIVEFQNEEEMPEWAQDVVHGKSPDMEDDEMDTPKGLQVELRPYQKQALYWMTQQEAKVSNHWRSDQLQLLKELAQMTSQNKSPPNKSTPPRNSGLYIFCDCGPVLVDVSSVSAPPVASIPVSYFETPHAGLKMLTTPKKKDDDTHPLWERHFLCNATKSHAVSYFVQPFLRRATSMSPPAPSPCRGGILADSMGLVSSKGGVAS